MNDTMAERLAPVHRDGQIGDLVVVLDVPEGAVPGRPQHGDRVYPFGILPEMLFQVVEDILPDHAEKPRRAELQRVACRNGDGCGSTISVMRLDDAVFRDTTNVPEILFAVLVLFPVPFAGDLVKVEIVADRLDFRSGKPVAPDVVWDFAHDLIHTPI